MESALSGLDADLADGIDKFIADRDQPPTPSMSRLDALNVIVRDWLDGTRLHPPSATQRRGRLSFPCR
jgi:hypothetical protein